MTLIQLPDDPRSDLETIQALATGNADYAMNQFVIVSDKASGREYFGQITGPQRNLNRTGLGVYDQTTITGLESVMKAQYGRDAVVQEAFLYAVRLLRDVTSGRTEVVTRRPQIGSLARAATEQEVIGYLNLPTRNESTLIGRIPGTDIGIYYDSKRLVYHSLLAGATGSGKSNVGANLIKASTNLGYATIVYDHKPDYQDMRYANPDGDDGNNQLMKVDYWYLGNHKKANGDGIFVPASCFSPSMLAATIFWNDSEQNQREELEHALDVYSEIKESEKVKHWTLNDWYWWYTAGKGSGAELRDVAAVVGHKPDSKTFDALCRKVIKRSRKPSWVDGVDISKPQRHSQNLTGASMGRIIPDQNGAVRYFDPINLLQAGNVLCIKVNGSEAGREYGLFLDFMLKRIYLGKTSGQIKFPVHHFIDEAQDIFSGSKRFAQAAGNSIAGQVRKGRSQNIAFTIAVQSADQVPQDILNNLNSRMILRHNNAASAKAALEKATDEQRNQTAYFGPGQALVDMFGSNAVIQAQMLRSPFKLTVDMPESFGGEE